MATTTQGRDMNHVSDLPKSRQESADSAEAIFGSHAVALRQAGLAVIPAKGKAPIRKGFSNWKHAPGLKAVEQWAETNAADNIVYIPGLSRTKRNPDGLVIVDADDRQTADEVGKLFGDTPAQIDTRKGRHFLYKAPEGSLGTVHSLRKFGFNVDIKHGQAGAGISVAPPSRHPDQRDFSYGWTKGSGIEALNDLPAFNVAALQRIIDQQTLRSDPLPNVTNCPRAAGRSLDQLRDGSRGLGLNDYLAAQAPWCDSLDDVIDNARSFAGDLANRFGLEMLDETEILKRAHAAWNDVLAGKLVRMHGKHQRLDVSAAEFEFLTQNFDNGADAVTLLLKMRQVHSARIARGETFVFVVNAMVKDAVIGRWAARRYRDARDTLMQAGLMAEVKASMWSGGKRSAAEYTLNELRQSINDAKPSLAA